MLPPNPLLQLVPPRVTKTLQRLEELIWRPLGSLAIEATEASPLHRTFREASELALRPVEPPFHWGRLFDQAWFRLTLPKGSSRERRYLRWKNQGESTAYIRGRPHFGIDIAHPYCPLPSSAREVWIESICLETGIWHPEHRGVDPQGSRCDGAELVLRDDHAWGAYHDLKVLFEVVVLLARKTFPEGESAFPPVGYKRFLDRIPPLMRRLLRHLDEAIDAFDTGGPAEMRAALAAAYEKLPAADPTVRGILTGHAHIDLVWLWPERIGDFKAVHSFATANRLMEMYPEFRFAYSQPASYRAVGKRSPELLRQVKRRIKAGQWEAVGATEVESDTVLPCGEALARSFLVGQEGFAELTGKPSPILWLPDVFGYAPCLPQIMRECGVRFFFTTKLTWSSITPFPYSSFLWRGHDGSEVLAHILHGGGYNGNVDIHEITRITESYKQADVHDEVLLPNGFGDGGGGVTEEMCERARRMADLAGAPPLAWDRVGDFFDRLERVRDRLPVYQGELYLEYHRGTFTTHGQIKAVFRACERALQTAEAARCARGGDEINSEWWRRLVFAQFHDYIPGSSISEVYSEAQDELTRITAEALGDASAGLSIADGKEALFNPLPHPRREVVHLPGRPEPAAIVLPPLAGRPVAELVPLSNLPPVRSTDRSLENGNVQATFDPQGRITALRCGNEPVHFTAPAGGFALYPDRPHLFEAWDIDRQTLALGKPVDTPASCQLEESGPTRGVIAFTRRLGDASRITTRYRLDAGASCLRVEYELDWQEKHTLLKVLYPTAHAGAMARFGVPFGSVLRPQQPGPQDVEAMWEVSASRWAAVTDDGEQDGFFLVTEAKYGFSARSGCLTLSLVRSATITGEGKGYHHVYPPAIRREKAASEVSDIGIHRINTAIGRYSAGLAREDHPAALADTLFTPLVSYRGPAVEAGLVKIEGDPGLLPVWARPAGPGAWFLRLNEVAGRRGTAKVVLRPGCAAFRSDLRGAAHNPLAPLTQVDFSPYELITLRIQTDT
ncbi:MAG: alpha-mannosidase [Puniceicoccaceae bacterium]|nr:MAG: alpha-mannosidase [Puniceicoccaceae bacterium]